MSEFNPQKHEEFVSQRLQKIRRDAARTALFEELWSYVDAGQCTHDQAVAQFLHDADVAGIGYPAPATDPSTHVS